MSNIKAFFFAQIQYFQHMNMSTSTPVGAAAQLFLTCTSLYFALVFNLYLDLYLCFRCMNTAIADTPVATQLFLTCASLDFERRAVIIAMDKTAAGCFRAKLVFYMQHQSKADFCVEDNEKLFSGAS